MKLVVGEGAGSTGLNGPPVIGSVVNAASAEQTAVAPGAIMTVWGANLATAYGPVQETKVLINGRDAGHVLFASPTQLNVALPGDLVPGSVATLQVRSEGSSQVLSLPVSRAAPGLVTADGSGVGQAAVLNEDDTLNSPSRPAAPGSVIQVFGTGVPDGVTTCITIGGEEAQVTYAGQAPGQVPGLVQINAVVPAAVAAGNAVPIVVQTGTASSRNRVTIAVGSTRP